MGTSALLIGLLLCVDDGWECRVQPHNNLKATQEPLLEWLQSIPLLCCSAAIWRYDRLAKENSSWDSHLEFLCIRNSLYMRNYIWNFSVYGISPYIVWKFSQNRQKVGCAPNFIVTTSISTHPGNRSQQPLTLEESYLRSLCSNVACATLIYAPSLQCCSMWLYHHTLFTFSAITSRILILQSKVQLTFLLLPLYVLIQEFL
jgi:hypothetical protein